MSHIWIQISDKDRQNLAHLVKVWPKLSEDIKGAINAIVGGFSGSSDSSAWAKAGPRDSEGDLGEAGAICETNKTRANQAAGPMSRRNGRTGDE